MKTLNWELQILSRAISYNNLSGAAQHVGLSQPQLSRIVRKLEEDLELNLLNRETKRKSTWSPSAHRLAEVYQRTLKTWQSELGSLLLGSDPNRVRIGTLEGLLPLAHDLAKGLFKLPSTQIIELDVYDLSSLEEIFFRGHFDFILTSREPGHRKHPYRLPLGYQTLDVRGSQSTKAPKVFSTYEWGIQQGRERPSVTKRPGRAGAEAKSLEKTLISNSLEVRRHWIQSVGGAGSLPSQVSKKSQGSASVPVILIGADRLVQSYWLKILGMGL